MRLGGDCALVIRRPGNEVALPWQHEEHSPVPRLGDDHADGAGAVEGGKCHMGSGAPGHSGGRSGTGLLPDAVHKRSSGVDDDLGLGFRVWGLGRDACI